MFNINVIDLTMFQTIDVSVTLARLTAEKDDLELELCRKAALASVNTWSYARKKIVDIIDQAKVRILTPPLTV